MRSERKACNIKEDQKEPGNMFIDTHMHEMTCSKDSFLKLEQMVEIAREKGLGAICITDH